MNKSLNILIPTYNRLDFLSEQLRRLCAGARLSNAAGNSVSITVDVLDNCSSTYTDSDIAQVVSSIQDDFISIRACRHEKNIGFCNNVLYGIRSLGQQQDHSLVWILSDDDIVDPYALSLLIGFIDSMRTITRDAILLPWFSSGIGTSSTIRGLVSCPLNKSNDILNLIHQNALISSWIYPSELLYNGLHCMSDDERNNQFFQIILNAYILSKSQFVAFDHCIGFERPNLVWRFQLANTFVGDRVTAMIHASNILGVRPSFTEALNKTAFIFLCKRAFLTSLTYDNSYHDEKLLKAGLSYNVLSLRALTYLALAWISNLLPRQVSILLFRSSARENQIATLNQNNAKLFVLGASF